MTSIVIQTSFLGDMVLTTPLLERLALRGPVDVVATPANAALLGNHPAVRDVIVFDKRGSARGWRGLRRVAHRLAWRDTDTGRVRRGASTAYLAQGSLRSASLALLAGIPERVGFATSAARLLYTRRVPYRRDAHHALRLWGLASAPGDDVMPATLRPSLYPGDADRDAVATLLAANGVGARNALLALAPGSVWATKRWPSYDALADVLVQRMMDGDVTSNARIVVVGAVVDRALALAISNAVQQRGGAPVIDATGQLSLLASAALLERAQLLVTNDSAPMHLASAMGTPTIALFGPTVPAFGFGPLSPRHHVIGVTTLSCRPCHAHGPQTCPLGHWRCMRELSPVDVADAAVHLMAGNTLPD